jgi:hypothetical protein
LEKKPGESVKASLSRMLDDFGCGSVAQKLF